MFGHGHKGVCLLADSDYEFKHAMFRRLLRRSGLAESDFYMGSVYEPNLLKEIQDRKISVMVPLGEKALGQVLGEAEILRWRGRVAPHPHLPGVWVMPLMQPRKLVNERPQPGAWPPPLRHPPRFHGTWIQDIHRAVGVAKNGFERRPVWYLEDPDPLRFDYFANEYFAALENAPSTMLSWDIETPYKAKNSDDEEELEEKEVILDGVILRQSFCFRPGYAVSIPESSSYSSTVRRLLGTKGALVVWNGRTFDVPVAQKAGYDVDGVVMDYMDGYHLYQSDLPKGLEWVSAEATDLLPWKHLSSAKPALYSCIDADAALRNAIYINEQFRTTGQTLLFDHHVTKLMPLLDEAGKHGNQVDPEKRLEMRSRLMAMRDIDVAEVQQYVPRELFPRTRYERQPDDVAGEYPKQFEPRELLALDGWDIAYEPSSEKVCSVCGKFASNKSEHFKGSVGPLNPKTGKSTRIKNPCKEAGATIDSRDAFAPKFLRLEKFNVNSSDQLKAYMRHFGHPIGRDKKDASKETADAGHIKFLIKKYGEKFPIYLATLRIHKASKAIGTYTPEPDAENILHTLYVNSTSTWRLGARKVQFGTQIQNWGKRGSDKPEDMDGNVYAKEARQQIISRQGHKLVQTDSSSVEAVLQGHYMNDVEYMLLASKSIHAWLACKELGLEFTPENVDLVKEKHERLYLQMKVVNYLTNFGGGSKLMTDTYPELFPTRKSADDAQDLLYKLLPSLKQYHHAVRWEAHTKTYLTTPWGYRHWYYDVFKIGFDGTTQLGKDAKRCVAFKPQNSNAGFQKDNLLLMGYSPIDGAIITDLQIIMKDFAIYERERKAGNTWARFMGTNVSIHDSGCLDTPNHLVDRCVEMQQAIFTRPIPQMRNLQVGAETEVGSNWGGFDEKKNLGGMKRVAKLVIDNYTINETESGGASAPLLRAA